MPTRRFSAAPLKAAGGHRHRRVNEAKTVYSRRSAADQSLHRVEPHVESQSLWHRSKNFLRTLAIVLVLFFSFHGVVAVFGGGNVPWAQNPALNRVAQERAVEINSLRKRTRDAEAEDDGSDDSQQLAKKATQGNRSHMNKLQMTKGQGPKKPSASLVALNKEQQGTKKRAKKVWVPSWIPWTEPSPSFGAVILLEMFRHCAFDNDPSESWDPAQSSLFQGAKQNEGIGSQMPDVQRTGIIRIEGGGVAFMGSTSDPVQEFRLPMTTAAQDFDPKGRVQLLLESLVANGYTKRNKNIQLRKWGSNKSPSTEEAEPSISLRVARDMGELPGLVPGLVTKSHWTTLDRQLPFDDSLALLFLQHNVQALPASWTYSLAACYDMIWVTSLAAKDELVQARIPANRIQVVPPLVQAYSSSGLHERFRFNTLKRNVFIVVVTEGRFQEQRLEHVLAEYVNEFSASDDVALAVIIEPITSSFADKQSQHNDPPVDWLNLWNPELETSDEADSRVPVSYFRSSDGECSSTFGCAPIVDEEQCLRAATADAEVWKLASDSPKNTMKHPDGGMDSGADNGCVVTSTSEVMRCSKESHHFPFGCSFKRTVSALEAKLPGVRYLKNQITLNTLAARRAPADNNTFSIFDSVKAASQFVAKAQKAALDSRMASPKLRGTLQSASLCSGDSGADGGHICFCQCTTPHYASQFLSPGSHYTFTADGQRSSSKTMPASQGPAAQVDALLQKVKENLPVRAVPQVIVKVTDTAHTPTSLGPLFRAATALVAVPTSGVNADASPFLEAAAAGLPIVGLRTPALSDWFERGIYDSMIDVERKPSFRRDSDGEGVRQFGWPLYPEDPQALRNAQRPGRQGDYVFEVEPRHNTSSSGALGTAMRHLLRNIVDAQTTASWLQRAVTPLLGAQGGGGLLRRRLEELVVLSRRQNFNPRRKQHRKFCFNTETKQSNDVPLWNRTWAQMQEVAVPDDRANDDDGYDVLKSWKFGLHDWAEASAQAEVKDFTLMAHLAEKLLVDTEIGANQRAQFPQSLCSNNTHPQPWKSTDGTDALADFSVLCGSTATALSTIGDNSWVFTLLDRCHSKFVLMEQDVFASFDNQALGTDVFESEATTRRVEAEGVLGEIQNLKQRFKQQRENMGQQKQQKAVDELKMGVQNWHSDRANPSLKAQFDLPEGVAPISHGTLTVKALKKEVIKPFCRGANEGPYLSLHDAERSRMPPSFFLLGVPKSGLRFHNIMVHRQMKEPKCREINFFADADMHSKGLSYYRRFFPWEAEGIHTGEASLQYFSKANTPRRIHHMLPDSRFVYIFRNPVQRFISRWLQPIEKAEWEEILKFEDAHGQSYDCMNVFQKFKSRTEKCLAEIPATYSEEQTLVAEAECMGSTKSHLTQGVYLFPLKAWVEEFPDPNQHLVLQQEWIVDHPIEAMQKVASHLGIFPFSESELRSFVRIGTDRYGNQQQVLAQINNEYSPCDEGELRNFFEPYNQRLREYLLSTFTHENSVEERWTYW